ncbi:MAG TPA: HD domain-containing phosphohydrolase [Candidatus Dormibacteraeota bacterium]
MVEPRHLHSMVIDYTDRELGILMSRRAEKRPLPKRPRAAQGSRVVYRASSRRFDAARLATSARETVRFKLPLLGAVGPWVTERVLRLSGARQRPAFRVLAVAFWAITTIRLISVHSGGQLHVSFVSAWAIPAAGFVLGVLCWGLPWLRVPVDHLLAAMVVGIALPLLYLSFAGNMQGDDLLLVYLAAAVFTAALLPLRIAMAVSLLGAIAAAVPLLLGWSAVYDRALLVLVSVVGLLTYTQARMLGNIGRKQREAEDRSRQIEESFMATLGALASSGFGNDRPIEAHARGTASLAVAVAQQLGLKGTPLRELELAALLHDVGKAGLPSELLNKPGPLTTEELARVHEHPVIAERILSRVPSLRSISPIIRAQYERWNGSGYPDGLAGERIPLGGRIIHACAAFHAMASGRAYRPAIRLDQIIDELRRQAGSQFDPRVVEAVIAVVEQGEIDLASIRRESETPPPASNLSRPWHKQLETIDQLGVRLGRETGVQQICRLTAEVAASLLPHDQARVYLVADDKRRLVPSYVSPPDRQESSRTALEHRILLPGEGIAGQVFQSRRGILVGDADPGLAGFEAPAMSVSAVAVPVLLHDDIVGVIEVVKLGSNQYSRSHLRVLKILANQMALSVANARLIDRMVA